jgi:hypothetical protein
MIALACRCLIHDPQRRIMYLHGQMVLKVEETVQILAQVWQTVVLKRMPMLGFQQKGEWMCAGLTFVPKILLGLIEWRWLW